MRSCRCTSLAQTAPAQPGGPSPFGPEDLPQPATTPNPSHRKRPFAAGCARHTSTRGSDGSWRQAHRGRLTIDAGNDPAPPPAISAVYAAQAGNPHPRAGTLDRDWVSASLRATSSNVPTQHDLGFEALRGRPLPLPPLYRCGTAVCRLVGIPISPLLMLVLGAQGSEECRRLVGKGRYCATARSQGGWGAQRCRPSPWVVNARYAAKAGARGVPSDPERSPQPVVHRVRRCPAHPATVRRM